MELLQNMLYSPFAIGIIAVGGGIIFALAQKIMHHRERMAMIERGIHPDYADDTAEKGQA